MRYSLLFLLFTSFAFIQTTYAQFGVDFSAGINNSTTKFEGLILIEPSSRVGYFVGVAPNFGITEKFRVRVDLQYSQKGYISNFPEFPDWERNEAKYNYLAFIPELEYQPLGFLTLGAGVNYSYRVQNMKVRIEKEPWMDAVSEPIKSTDFGLVGKVKLNYKNFFGFARYTLGTKDIVDINFTDDNGVTIDDIDLAQYNRNLQIGLGYAVSL